GRGASPRRYDDVDAALAALDEWLAPGESAMVKASNSSGLGRLADSVVERMGDTSTRGGGGQG
ncbi:MAG: hypothetical protein JWM98_20, partial [Thermoleophilia bacterium]|nr:hypothetical protein [Thermoleophilia bacterium]